MFVSILSTSELILFTLGILLVLTAMIKYSMRTADYQCVWRVFVKKLKNGFTISEFKIYRLGVATLIFALILRLLNQILFPS